MLVERNCIPWDVHGSVQDEHGCWIAKQKRMQEMGESGIANVLRKQKAEQNQLPKLDKLLRGRFM